MGKVKNRMLISLLCINLAFVACSCGLKESYKEFYIRDITDNLNKDFFDDSNDLAFAKLLDVVFIPEIREINHGEYVIYVSVYSKYRNENINIKKISILEGDLTLFDYKLNKMIQLENNENDIYEGWAECETFSKDILEVVDGKRYDLIINAEVTNGEITESKNIVYEIVIKGYKSFVWPT